MSTSIDDLMAMRAEIESVNPQDIVSVGMVLKHYLQGVENVLVCLNQNKVQLEAAGMDFKAVDRVKLLAGAARELSSKMSMSNPANSIQAEWNVCVEEAEELIYDIKEAMNYAFRNNPELLNKLSYIREGGSNADFIQDLNDFATLGRDNKDLLTTIGYDLAHIERAAELSKKMAELYAQVTINKSVSPELTVSRDKAFTLLKKGIDELNLQARYILRADKSKAADFVIRPPRKKSVKKVTETENEKVTA